MNNTFSDVKVEPTVKIHWIFFAAALMHLVFLITFTFFKMYLMVAINVVSILMYVVGGFVIRNGRLKNAYRWIISFFIEVLFHAVVCTFIQGVDISFYLYPLMAMPVYGYLLFGYCDRPTLLRTSLVMAITTFVLGTVTLVFVDRVGSVYTLTGVRELTQHEIITMRSINVTFTTLMLMIFTLAFYMELMKLINRLNESNEQLDYIATHDALTGLCNRHSIWQFFDRLGNSGESYCIILGDLDDFKKINDTYGHECGDIVLKSVAGIILDKTRDDEMACRWGGEEILIAMRGEREDCLKRVGEIKEMISGLGITNDGANVKVTMTFGFVGSEEVPELCKSENSAEKPFVQKSLDGLITLVDKRLYVGKRSGKNTIVAA